MAELEDLAVMEQEHHAWVYGVVAEFKRLHMDINEERFDWLIAAINAWGEELAWLRCRQDPADVNKAYCDRLEDYSHKRDIPPGVGTIWDRLAEEAQTKA